jgi:hypothetical protein
VLHLDAFFWRLFQPRQARFRRQSTAFPLPSAAIPMAVSPRPSVCYAACSSMVLINCPRRTHTQRLR